MKRRFPLLLFLGWLAIHPNPVSAQSSAADHADFPASAMVTREFPISPEFQAAVGAGLTTLQVHSYLERNAHVQFPEEAQLTVDREAKVMTVRNMPEFLAAIADHLRELRPPTEPPPIPEPGSAKVITYWPPSPALEWRKRARENTLPAVAMEKVSLQKAVAVLAQLTQEQEAARTPGENARPFLISIEPWIARPSVPDPSHIPGLDLEAGPQDPTQNVITYSATNVSPLAAIQAVARPLGYHVHFLGNGIVLKSSPQYFVRKYLLSPNAIDFHPPPSSVGEALEKLAAETREYRDRPRPELNLPFRTLVATETDERQQELEATFQTLWQDYYTTGKTSPTAAKTGASNPGQH